MADDGTTTEGTEPPQATRLDRLEATQHEQGETLNRIETMLSHVLPSSHAEAQERTEARLDRGSSLAEQVKAELAKAREDEAAAKAAEDEKNAEKSERQELRELAAQLREKPPAPPRNPVKRFATIGWGDGR